MAMTMMNRLHAVLAPLIYGDRIAVIPPSVNANWPERQFLRQMLKRLEVDCVLDVGANIGQYAVELRLIGFRGLILSFEPSPGCFATLAARAAADRRWHAINCALGSVAGEAEMNEMAVSLFNSFLSPATDETVVHAGANTIARSTPVSVDTLSNLLPALQAKYGFRRPFLKMDTQGFDIQVFRGGAAVHDRIVGLQSELSVKRLYEGAPKWTEAIAEYEAAGFEIAGFHKVNPQDPHLIECDCFFVRGESVVTGT